ncbi:sensor domain-containing diguanylate cyclase [Thalassomonas viridans]|uniref:Sensor domain-containing diguanylate cyclase n=1 Tax=Thalassomonas viridans TaxID=137584 RepID=A0AAF0CB52_9GAMM|nr:sensor domain-containing diguanylate cyclase [Thalassomonas viridans]WDE06945.1 sensor domain-containing diguanylate cyclase [Thalassomonas viridans]
MQSPQAPANEQKRLKTLHSLNILDTPPQERFDRLVRMAKRVFNVPIALVSLVDEKRQWFKARVGLNATETSREVSFCGHTILCQAPFIITDARKDLRFADNPLVTGPPNIVFYAGCPLHFFDGTALGTLCIIDTHPRQLGDEDLVLLKDLAHLTERELAATHLATQDDLTGIVNRRGFLTLAEKALTLSARGHLSLVLAYFDLDSFKAINDNFGHEEGDLALKIFSQLMQRCFRESDIIARLGGDEFVVLLTNADETFARESISRFRYELDQYNRQANKQYQLAFSDGIAAVTPENNSSIAEMLKQADEQMYRQKRDKMP